MRTRTWIIIAVVVAALFVAAVVFKPWLLFVDIRVDEALPSTAPVVPSPTGSDSPALPSSTPSPTAPVALASGTFTSHEHNTSGTATIIENPDGTRVLAIENLDTSNGPDVHVWLSASDVVEGRDGWYTAGGAEFVDLGLIKGNLGNQVYDIPADVNLDNYRSVALWCVQFSVSFGAAQLG
jgi:hypothetical protein